MSRALRTATVLGSSFEAPPLRAVLISLVLVLAATQVEAGVSAFPPSYRSRGDDYYENLRAAKLAWLKTNAAAVSGDLAQAQAALTTAKGDAKPTVQATIDRLGKQADRIAAELAVMRGPRNARQETLLKRNVEAWIGAARRARAGGEAIRLMHDLEGTGL